MDEWWLLGRDRKPIGPASTDLVRKGILSGRVPGDSLVCEVGGAEWRSIREVGAFTKTFAALRIDGPTMVDAEEPLVDPFDDKTATHSLEALVPFESQVEHTVADARPIESESSGAETDGVTIRPKLQRFDEGTEHTVVDEPLRVPNPRT